MCWHTRMTLCLVMSEYSKAIGPLCLLNPYATKCYHPLKVVIASSEIDLYKGSCNIYLPNYKCKDPSSQSQQCPNCIYKGGTKYVYTSTIIQHNVTIIILWSLLVHITGSYYALKPLCRELQGLEGIETQACAEASAICSFFIPTLQMFAKDLICFMPY